MAIAQTITVVDGKTYQPGEEIWDLGSFACVDVRGNIRSYEGLSSDISKLPHVFLQKEGYCGVQRENY